MTLLTRKDRRRGPGRPSLTRRFLTALVLLAALTGATPQVASSKPDRVVVDVVAWKHPTKAVFAATTMKLVRVELHRGSVYPVFYVSGGDPLTVVTPTFARALSAANAWWPSEIRRLTTEGRDTIAAAGPSGSFEGDLEVDSVVVLAANRSAKTVSVKRLLTADQAIDRAATVLGGRTRTPVKVGGETITFSYLLDGVPLAPVTRPAFWSVSLGEDHPDHRVTLRRVDVDAFTGEVWEVDPIDGQRTRRLKG